MYDSFYSMFFRFIFMAEPIMNLLFPGKADGFMILKYLSISVPFLVGTQITTSILQGMGYYYRPVFHLFIGCILKVVLTMNLIPIKIFKHLWCCNSNNNILFCGINIKFNIYG